MSSMYFHTEYLLVLLLCHDAIYILFKLLIHKMYKKQFSTQSDALIEVMEKQLNDNERVQIKFRSFLFFLSLFFLFFFVLCVLDAVRCAVTKFKFKWKKKEKRTRFLSRWVRSKLAYIFFTFDHCCGGFLKWTRDLWRLKEPWICSSLGFQAGRIW